MIDIAPFSSIINQTIHISLFQNDMLQQMYLQLMKSENESRIIIRWDEWRGYKTLNQNGFIYQKVDDQNNLAATGDHT